MTDIKLDFLPVPAGELPVLDAMLLDGDLATGDELRTAVLISLFTDRRAAEDDAVPINSADPRGWWGDDFASVDGDQIGSRLWLLAKEKQTPQTLQKIKDYCAEALQWLIDDGIAANIDVFAEWTGINQGRYQVAITKPDGTSSRYEFLWEQVKSK